MKTNQNIIDYKNLGYIKKYISEAGKLIPSRVSGLRRKRARKMNKAIKIARFLALYYLIATIINDNETRTTKRC